MARTTTSSAGKSPVELPSVYSEEDIEQIAALLELSDASRLPELEEYLNTTAFIFRDARTKVDEAPRLSQDRAS